MSKFQKILEKKKGGLDEMGKNAHRTALQGIRKEATDFMADKLRGLKKVTVASPDQEGLAEGLDKAKELVEEDQEHGAEEGDEQLTPETIDEQIQHLMKLKESLERHE